MDRVLGAQLFQERLKLVPGQVGKGRHELLQRTAVMSSDVVADRALGSLTAQPTAS